MAYELHVADDGILWLTVIGDFGKEDAEAYLRECAFSEGDKVSPPASPCGY